MKVIIYGLFGGRNFGDELFSKVVTDAVTALPGAAPPIIVTSNDENTSHNVGPHEALVGYPIPRKGFSTWLNSLKKYREASGMLFGGGGLFNEVFLRAGIPAHGIALATAKFFGVPYILHGIELGYVDTTINRFITRWCLRNAQRVICRNELSIQRADDQYQTTVERGVDLNHAWLHDHMRNAASEHGGKRKLMVNLQHSLKTDDAFIDQLLRDKRAEGYEIVFVINGQGEREKIHRRFPDLQCELILAETVQTTINAWSQGSAFITERFHFTLAALHSSHPTYVIVSSSKVKEAVNEVEEAGGTVRVLREGQGERTVLCVEPGPARDRVMGEWARRSREQLKSVADEIARLNEGGSRKRSIEWSTLPVLLAMYAALLYQFVLDKFRPLKRELNTGVT